MHPIKFDYGIQSTIDGYKKTSAFYCIPLEDKSVMPSTNYQNQTIFVGLVCIESTTAVKEKKKKGKNNEKESQKHEETISIHVSPLQRKQTLSLIS